MKPPRVLIVDDNDLNVQLVTFVLGQAAFTVDSASDGKQLMLSVAACRPDLILMDIQMPGTDGLELTRRLKACKATQDIVVVAFTAYAMVGDEAKMRTAGCDGYIAKPIDVRTFAAQVGSYISTQPASELTAVQATVCASSPLV